MDSKIFPHRISPRVHTANHATLLSEVASKNKIWILHIEYYSVICERKIRLNFDSTFRVHTASPQPDVVLDVLAKCTNIDDNANKSRKIPKYACGI